MGVAKRREATKVRRQRRQRDRRRRRDAPSAESS